ncbi:MAG: twin arginine-targeting protein translocase TatB [Halothiobacillus sp. 13-55-115]|nr:MAG: twin arginine-targeting protein translocase TatB [Halothiobacillus sp. 13-55-115]
MFGFSIWEIFLILVIALLVVGPERLPGLARTIGTWVHKIKKFVANAKAELDSEFNFQDMKDILNSQESEIAKLRALVEETRQEVNESGRQVLGAVDDAEASFRAAAQSEQAAEDTPLKAIDDATSAERPASTENKQAETGKDADAATSPVKTTAPTSVPLSFDEEIRMLEESSGQAFKRPFAPAEPVDAPSDTADANKSSPSPDSKTS